MRDVIPAKAGISVSSTRAMLEMNGDSRVRGNDASGYTEAWRRLRAQQSKNGR